MTVIRRPFTSILVSLNKERNMERLKIIELKRAKAEHKVL